MKILLICIQCKKVFWRYESTIRNNYLEVCCSRKCRNEYQKICLIGNKNPNFGNKWNDKQKANLANKVSERFANNKEYGEAVSKIHSGKKLSKEHRKILSTVNKGRHHLHSNETKKLIAKASSEKWTDDFKIAFRKTMEERGHWIPLELKSAKILYFKASNWICRMFDLIIDIDQLNMLREFGVFNSTKNTTGVVRDHIYSRLSGFSNDVYPELLRHPANCQLLFHADNIRKKSSRYIDKDGCTLENLFINILNYNGIWKEQEKCLFLIEQYNKGYRYSNNDKE